MNLKNVRELGAHLASRFPALWEYRFHLAAFVLLFLIFFIVNLRLLEPPAPQHAPPGPRMNGDPRQPPKQEQAMFFAFLGLPGDTRPKQGF
jgi:hypothetical protein